MAATLGVPLEHTNFGSLFPDERRRIIALRRAAADLYRTFGDKIGGRLSAGAEGRLLHSEVTLRAAVTALRLTILDGEQANFVKVIASLQLLKDPAIDARLDVLVAAWQKIEEGMIQFYGPHGHISARAIRDAWLFGRVSHHREEHEQTLTQMREWGDLNRPGFVGGSVS